MTIQEAAARQKEVMDEFVQLCQMGRVAPGGVPVSMFVKNLHEYQKASSALWDAMFKSIAGTGVVVDMSW